MKKIINYLDKKFYPLYQDYWDDKLFRLRILNHLRPDMILLDIGAGAGILPEMNFKGLAKEVYGVDTDERVVTNPFLNKGIIGIGQDMPFFEDEKFDVIISDNVLEHLNEPLPFFIEVNRVLKRGGIFLTKTPNIYHYMPLIASITPTWFHEYFNKLRGRSYEDTFPTYYKSNTKVLHEELAKKSNFNIEKIELIEARPEYLRITLITYLLGIAYEKIINGLNLENFKILLISQFRK